MLKKLILENYIPLLSSGITSVELDIKGMVNLFIAPSGTGKTSILKELHALPPENGNYKQGRKYVEIQHQGKLFKLDSRTGVGNGHSFKIGDGPELNTGGTFSAQKELVFNYLGRMNSDIVKVLNGLKILDRLSAMSPNRRKDIIMAVYPNDTSEALDVYQKLKTERNELKATIKNQVARFTAENAKLQQITAIGTAELEARIKLIDEDVAKSLMMRGELANIKANPELRVKMERFNFLTDKLLVNKLGGGLHTEEELVNALGTAQSLMETHQDQMNVLKGIIAEHSEFLDGLEDLLKDPEAFREQARHLEEDMVRTNLGLSQYDQLLLRADVFNDPDTPLDGLQHIVEAFKTYLNDVVMASSEDLTRATYRKYLTDDEELGNLIRNRTNQLEDLRHKLKHYQSMDHVECPDCNSKFKVGVTQQDIERLQGDIVLATEFLETCKARKEKLRAKIDNDAEWYRGMNNLYDFVRSNAQVRCLPELVKAYNIGKAPSNVLCNVLSAYVESVELKRYKAVLAEEEKIVKSRLDLINREGLTDTAEYVTRKEAELSKSTGLMQYYQGKVTTLTAELNNVRFYQRDLEELRSLRREIFADFANQANVKLRGALDEHVSQLQSEKKEAMMGLISASSLTAVVQSISADIEMKKRRLAIVEVWMDGICPNKGLIGKLMGDFINSLCGNINATIKRFWNTTLYIKPCSKENGDLNYKFPVVTGDKEPTPDVSDCSGGETDAVDWAFRFVLMDYVGFPFPLVLDEVGITFDEIKRGRFLDFLKDYTMGKNPRQLFMASHYFAQYGVFNKPNIIGLRHEGLTLPGQANTNTVIA